MLTVGSVHLHYLSNPMDQIKALKMVRSSRRTVMTLLQNTMLSTDIMRATPVENCDIALAALLSCTIASVSDPLLWLSVSLIPIRAW